MFSFRPNMENPDHREAWRILKEIPEGQKNLFLVRAILNEHDTEYLQEIIRKTVREELESCSMEGRQVFRSDRQEAASAAEEVPEQVLDFISMLQDE